MRQFIPPEIGAAAQLSGREEDRCGDAGPIKDRLGLGEIVEISVIKGDGDGVARQAAILKPPNELVHRQRQPKRPQSGHLIGKVLWTDGEAPWIMWQLSDAVIHQ